MDFTIKDDTHGCPHGFPWKKMGPKNVPCPGAASCCIASSWAGAPGDGCQPWEFMFFFDGFTWFYKVKTRRNSMKKWNSWFYKVKNMRNIKGVKMDLLRKPADFPTKDPAQKEKSGPWGRWATWLPIQWIDSCPWDGSYSMVRKMLPTNNYWLGGWIYGEILARPPTWGLKSSQELPCLKKLERANSKRFPLLPKRWVSVIH